jgi:hypothetical protein
MFEGEVVSWKIVMGLVSSEVDGSLITVGTKKQLTNNIKTVMPKYACLWFISAKSLKCIFITFLVHRLEQSALACYRAIFLFNRRKS